MLLKQIACMIVMILVLMAQFYEELWMHFIAH